TTLIFSLAPVASKVCSRNLAFVSSIRRCMRLACRSSSLIPPRNCMPAVYTTVNRASTGRVKGMRVGERRAPREEARSAAEELRGERGGGEALRNQLRKVPCRAGPEGPVTKGD